MLGGASLVFTSIVHPEGIAPFFQGLFQHFGRWLRRARGPEWLAVLRRLGPVALLGAVLGALVWPVRVDSYSWFWMPLLGAGLALFIRSIIMRISEARRGGGRPHGPHAPTIDVGTDQPASTVETTVPVAETV